MLLCVFVCILCTQNICLIEHNLISLQPNNQQHKYLRYEKKSVHTICLHKFGILFKWV